MKTSALCGIALFFCTILSYCTKEERSLKNQTLTAGELANKPFAGTSILLADPGTCPDCVANFTPTTSTATTNAVFTLNNSTGALTANGTTTTRIESTVETYSVGNVLVTVSHDADNIYFTLERDNAIGSFGNFRFQSPAQIPVPSTGPGNTEVPEGTKKIQIIRSRSSLPACSQVSFSFSVGGGGNATVGGQVATSSALTYTLRDICPTTCSIEVGDYRTQTRGFWRNNNGKAFLDAHNGLFPLTIGCTGNNQSFSNSTDVKTWLDGSLANGTPAMLPTPGTLGAQVLTLLINVKADDQVADFGAAAGNLEDLVVNISDADILAHPSWAGLVGWNGKTVADILATAQDVLGGCSTAYTPSQINEIVTAINENFDNGTIDNGLLTCGQ